MSLLLIDDCTAQEVVFSTQEMPQRSISTPSGEGNMRGSQEAFTELLRTSHPCAASSALVSPQGGEIATAHTRAKTEYCLCYDSALAPAETIHVLRDRLENRTARAGHVTLASF